MTEERSPWKGAAVGAGGGSLLAAALGYIYGHRGKWLAYDALTGGALGGAAGYGIEKFNKDRLDTDTKKQEEKATGVNTVETRDTHQQEFAANQEKKHKKFKEQSKVDDSLGLKVKGQVTGSAFPSEAYGNKATQLGARLLNYLGVPNELSEPVADTAFTVVPGPRIALNALYKMSKRPTPNVSTPYDNMMDAYIGKEPTREDLLNEGIRRVGFANALRKLKEAPQQAISKR